MSTWQKGGDTNNIPEDINDLIDWVFGDRSDEGRNVNKTNRRKMMTLVIQTAASKTTMKTTFNNTLHNECMSVQIVSGILFWILLGQTTLWMECLGVAFQQLWSRTLPVCFSRVPLVDQVWLNRKVLPFSLGVLEQNNSRVSINIYRC